MSDRLGPILLGQKDSQPFLGRDFGHTADYSGQVAEQIDREIRHLLDLAHDEALMVLVENEDVLEAMGQALLEEETLEGERLKEILSGVRERPSRAAVAPDGQDPTEVIRLLRRYESSNLNGSAGNGSSGNGSGGRSAGPSGLSADERDTASPGAGEGVRDEAESSNWPQA